MKNVTWVSTPNIRVTICKKGKFPFFNSRLSKRARCNFSHCKMAVQFSRTRGSSQGVVASAHNYANIISSWFENPIAGGRGSSDFGFSPCHSKKWHLGAMQVQHHDSSHTSARITKRYPAQHKKREPLTQPGCAALHYPVKPSGHD